MKARNTSFYPWVCITTKVAVLSSQQKGGRPPEARGKETGHQHLSATAALPGEEALIPGGPPAPDGRKLPTRGPLTRPRSTWKIFENVQATYSNPNSDFLSHALANLGMKRMETLPDRINRKVFLLTLKPDRSMLLGVFSFRARVLVTDLGSPSAGMRICQLLGSLVGGSLEGLIPLCSLRKARFMDLKTEAQTLQQMLLIAV